MNAHNTGTFEPIADPLSLSPVDFVARARERGLRLVGGGGEGWFNRWSQCGCVVGVSAVLAGPKLAEGFVGLADAEATLGLSLHQLIALSDGFEGVLMPDKSYLDPADYDTWYAKGRAVARAAGLEEQGGET